MCGLQMNSTYAFLRSMIHIQPSLGNYPSPCFWKYYVAGAFGLHRFSKRGDYWKMLLFKVLEAQIVQLVKSRKYKYKFFCEKKLLYLRQNFHILHYIKTKRCNIFFSKNKYIRCLDFADYGRMESLLEILTNCPTFVVTYFRR